MAGHSTMFDVIDYLIASFTAATAGLAEVYDGLSDDDTVPVWVSVGGTTVATSDGAQSFATMPASAARSREELYVVNCFLSSFVGSFTSDGQRQARQAARAAYAAIEDAIYGDFRLGGLVLTAQIETVALDQTNDTDPAPGRRTDLAFGIRCRARI